MKKRGLNPLIHDDFIAPVCGKAIEMVYQDESILVINKPSGLLSLSGKNPKNLDSVHYRLAQEFEGIKLLHRLDFGTSGIMVLAKTTQATKQVSRQFQQGLIKKHYIAVLHGIVDSDEGVIDGPIGKCAKSFPRVIIDPEQGKPALSYYHVLERQTHPDRSRVLFKPQTGRTHQLRIHSQYFGHPIVGCDLYGNPELEIEPQTRLHLHAQSLSFFHPLTGQAMEMSCVCPF